MYVLMHKIDSEVSQNLKNVSLYFYATTWLQAKETSSISSESAFNKSLQHHKLTYMCHNNFQQTLN
jgi:hypothetical protein